MGFKANAYATVWEVTPGKGNFTKVRLSTSKKNKEGEYETDFSGFCMFVSQAHAKAQRLKQRDRIRLGDVEVTTTYNKDTKKEYVNYKVYDYEIADSAPVNTNSGSSMSVAESNTVEAGDDLPF